MKIQIILAKKAVIGQRFENIQNQIRNKDCKERER